MIYPAEQSIWSKLPLKSLPVLLLFLGTFCSSNTIKDKYDMANAESDMKKQTEKRLTDVEVVAKGSVPGLEKKAVQVISDTPGKEARDSLLRLSENKNKGVQKAALTELGERKEEKTGELLLKKVRKQKTKVPEGLIALGRLKVDTAVPLLKNEVDNKPNQRAAMTGLSLIGNEESNDFIIDKARDADDTELQISAIEAMANIVNQRSRSTLEDIMRDKDSTEEVRIASIQTLGKIGNKKSAEKLAVLYNNIEGQVEVKKAIIAARARMFEKSQEEIMDEMRLEIWKKEFASSRRKSRPKFRGVKGLSLRDGVNKMAGGNVARKIDRALRRLSSMKTPNAQLAYNAYLAAYPNLNFSQIQNKMRQGLKSRRPFRILMRRVSRDYKNDGMRVLALQSMFKLSRGEAQGLLRAYKRGQL